jgi:hypothetical protein
MKYQLTIFLLSIVTFSFAQPKPILFEELIDQVNTYESKSITEGENFSLLIKNIYMNEFDVNRPDKVLEITCTFHYYNSSPLSVSTVHEQSFKPNPNGAQFSEEFYVIRDESLNDVEKIELKMKIRSITKQQNEMFTVVSKLFNQASSSNPAISVVNKIIDVLPKDSDSQTQSIEDIIYVPNNFIHFNQIEANQRTLPVLKNNEDMNIIFDVTNKKLPKEVVDNLFNFIFKGEKVKTKENIAGVITVLATKDDPKPLHPAVEAKLDDLYDLLISNIRSDIRDKFDIKTLAVEEQLDLLYPDESDKGSFAYMNAKWYLQLCRVFKTYLQSDDPKGFSDFKYSFKGWYSDIYLSDFSKSLQMVPIYTYEKVAGVDYPDAKRASNLFTPLALENKYIKHGWRMQIYMHSSIKKKQVQEKDLVQELSFAVNKDGNKY